MPGPVLHVHTDDDERYADALRAAVQAEVAGVAWAPEDRPRWEGGSRQRGSDSSCMCRHRGVKGRARSEGRLVGRDPTGR